MLLFPTFLPRARPRRNEAKNDGPVLQRPKRRLQGRSFENKRQSLQRHNVSKKLLQPLKSNAWDEVCFFRITAKNISHFPQNVLSSIYTRQVRSNQTGKGSCQENKGCLFTAFFNWSVVSHGYSATMPLRLELLHTCRPIQLNIGGKHTSWVAKPYTPALPT